MKTHLSPDRHSWFYFALFTVCNGLIAYSSLAHGIKLGILFFGIGIPVADVLKSRYRLSPRDPFDDGFPKTSGKAIFFVLFAAAWVRFDRLSDFSIWPLFDDGCLSLIAYQWSQHWSWSPTCFYTQNGSLFVWLLAVLFKLFDPSLTIMYLLPAVFSYGSIFMIYLAVHRFFPRPFAMVVAVFYALGYPGMQSGRYCNFMSLFILWICFCACLLGGIIKTHSRQIRKWEVIGLGSATGLGFYIYQAWPAAALLITGGVFAFFRHRRSCNWALGLSFILPMMITASPILWGSLNHNGWDYIHHQFATCDSSGSGCWQQILISVSYLTVHLWGTHNKDFNYGPIWGGYLNPLLGSLLISGFIRMAKCRHDPRVRWLLISGGVLSLPGVLTNNLELIRISAVIPIVLVCTAFGWPLFFSRLDQRHRTLIFWFIVMTSFVFDYHHLYYRYRTWAKPTAQTSYHVKNTAQYMAYQILSAKASSGGPGMIFTRFTTDTRCLEMNHQSLFFSVFPFNGVVHPKWAFRQCRWAAVLADPDYRLMLAERFPGLKWFDLSSFRQQNNKLTLGLGIWEILPDQWPVIEHWMKSDLGYCRLMYEALNHPQLLSSGAMFRKQQLQTLSNLYASNSADPFLDLVWRDKTSEVRFPKAVPASEWVRPLIGAIDRCTRLYGRGRILTGLFDLSQSSALRSALNGLSLSNESLINPNWLGLVSDIHYLPFLKKDHPEGHAYILNQYQGTPWYILWVLPITKANNKTAHAWMEADRCIFPLSETYDEQEKGRCLSQLDLFLPAYKTDPFLSSLYGELKSNLYSQMMVDLRDSPNLQKRGGNSRLVQNYNEANIEAIKFALSNGYSAAHLWEHLGLALQKNGDTDEAAKAFRSALKAPLDYTGSSHFLQQLLSSSRK